MQALRAHFHSRRVRWTLPHLFDRLTRQPARRQSEALCVPAVCAAAFAVNIASCLPWAADVQLACRWRKEINTRDRLRPLLSGTNQSLCGLPSGRCFTQLEGASAPMPLAPDTWGDTEVILAQAASSPAAYRDAIHGQDGFCVCRETGTSALPFAGACGAPADSPWLSKCSENWFRGSSADVS
jgi:hypothetical protein